MNETLKTDETTIFAALVATIQEYAAKHPAGEQIRVREYVRRIKADTRKRLKGHYSPSEILEVWTTILLANSAHAKGMLTLPGAPGQA